MALRDQPYLALYIQDFMTDEKLIECSALATGVYIRLMCVLHKSDPYGKFLLKQKDKQNEEQIIDFATKLDKHLPYDLPTIIAGLTELITEKCLHIEGDFLVQKRMVRDGELSIKRSQSGKKGGEETQKRVKEFAKAKDEANTEIEYVIEINKDLKDSTGGMEEEKGEFIISENLELPPFDIEAAERNQYAHTKNRNTDFVKEQWKIFLIERMNDPPGKKIKHKRLEDLTSYFLNFLRNKFPKLNGSYQQSSSGNGQSKAGTSTAQVNGLRNLREKILGPNSGSSNP